MNTMINDDDKDALGNVGIVQPSLKGKMKTGRGMQKRASQCTAMMMVYNGDADDDDIYVKVECIMSCVCLFVGRYWFWVGIDHWEKNFPKIINYKSPDNLN